MKEVVFLTCGDSERHAIIEHDMAALAPHIFFQMVKMNGVRPMDTHESLLRKFVFNFAERTAHEGLPAIGKVQHRVVAAGFQIQYVFDFLKVDALHGGEHNFLFIGFISPAVRRRRDNRQLEFGQARSRLAGWPYAVGKGLSSRLLLFNPCHGAVVLCVDQCMMRHYPTYC